MAKTVIVSAAILSLISRGDDPPYPPVSAGGPPGRKNRDRPGRPRGPKPLVAPLTAAIRVVVTFSRL